MYICIYTCVYMRRGVLMYVCGWVHNPTKNLFIYIYTDLLCKFLKLYETNKFQNLYMTYEKIHEL